MATIVNTARDRRFEGVGQGVADFLKARREKRKMEQQKRAIQDWAKQAQEVQTAEDVEKLPLLSTLVETETVDELVKFSQLDSVLREKVRSKFSFDEDTWINPDTGQAVTLPSGAEPPGPGFQRTEDVSASESLESSNLEQTATAVGIEGTRASTEGTRARTEATREQTAATRQERELYGPEGATDRNVRAVDFLRRQGIAKPSRSDRIWAADVFRVMDNVGGDVGLFGGGEDSNAVAIRAEIDKLMREEARKPVKDRKSAQQIEQEATEAVTAEEDIDFGDAGGEGGDTAQAEGDEKRSGSKVMAEGILRDLTDFVTGGAASKETRTRPSTGIGDKARESESGRASRPKSGVETGKVEGKAVNLTLGDRTLSIDVSNSTTQRESIKQALQSGEFSAGEMVKLLSENFEISREEATALVSAMVKDMRRGQ